MTQIIYIFLKITNFITKSCYNIITIHTHVVNHVFPNYKLYKVILYLYHTSTQGRSQEFSLGGPNCSIDTLTIVHIEYKIIYFDILSNS